MKRAMTWLGPALAVLLTVALAQAQEPANHSYAPAPPGTIVSSRVVYLAGEAMHSQWRAVLSKAPVGHDATRTFYQWYLSIYAIDGSTYRLKYQSPRDGAPFSRVEKAKGVQMWFPAADASIAGVAELMGSGAQQVVIASQEVGADCGTARVDAFFFDAATKAVTPALSVTNGCSLTASVVHDAQGTALALTGPYYGPTAALCCPTKPKATAIFRFHDGTWTQKPRYFTVLGRR